MVIASEYIPLTDNKRVDEDAFVSLVRSRYPAEFADRFESQLADLHQFADEQVLFELTPIDFALEMAAILYELNADPESILACLFYPILRLKLANDEKRRKMIDGNIYRISEGVVNMRAAKVLLHGKDSLSQVDRLRKMLLAMINDVRVVLVKLAERLVVMRHLYEQPESERADIAQAVMQIYAPLANRLGIGQLKWELEDRGFRALHDADYRQITSQLDERRIDRENYVTDFIANLTAKLQAEGVDSEISGRVKHIYSIYRKMQKKDLSFQQLFDIQALRILVKDVSSCYRALSVVHQNWESIPREFDDYISTPKANGYRSIHTVVKGPNAKNVEIQIRTYGMHEESEMGVAAHWRYKEGTSRDASYENRISWLRSLLDWQRELGEEDANIEAVRSKVVDDRVYVFTPLGQVIDLPKGATPLDFAYHLHTDLGHRCRGAKVHGHIVPLTYQLSTGDEMEVLTTNESRPSRDWLSERTGYINTSRARQKVSAWFRAQDRDEKPVVKAEAPKETPLLPSKYEREFKPKTPKPVVSDFIIEGVDNALIIPAGCCRPVMGDNIVGYITQGKGVKVHRDDCSQLAIVCEQNPERILPVEWASQIKGKYPLQLSIYARNRPDLLRDITAVIANEKLSIVGMGTQIDKKQTQVTISLTVEVPSRSYVEKLSKNLEGLEGVASVVRR